MSSPAKMNAKERRKLLRQQQQEAAEAKVKVEVKPEPAEPAEAPTLSAKERRKLLRQQKQQEAGVKADVETDVKADVKTEPANSEAPEAPGLNAKERRKLLRQQQQAAANGQQEEKKEEPPAVAASGKVAAAPAASGERLNAKQRRMLQRKTTRGEDPTASSKKEAGAESAEENHQQIGKKRKRKAKSDENGEDAEQEAKRKRIHLTLFVGQLPFKCTEAMVRKHFAEAGEIQLRMLTDKKTNKFKGTAFIEVKDSKALGAALSRHHTLLNGRRINVELTASGGGNKSEQRRGKIDGLRKKQSEKQIEKTRALVQKYIDAPGSKLKAEDVDERMIDYLSWFDYTTAKNAMEEYNRCVSDRVKNTKAFFMGILKRFRQTDGVE